MAEVWTQRIEPYTGEYDADSMTYHTRKLFSVEGIEDDLHYVLARDAGASTYPASFTLEHPTYRLVDRVSLGTRTVTLYPGAKRILSTTTAGHAEIGVEYAGRVLGTQRVITRAQMTAQIQRASLVASPDGTYAALGVDGDGVTIDIPMIVTTVIESVEATIYDGVLYLARLIAGAVNENNWDSPWGITYPLGQWIYLGPTMAVMDRLTFTGEVQHAFARLQNRKNQHEYRWQEVTMIFDPNGVPIQQFGEWKMGRSLKLAGTDKWWDDTTDIPEFSYLMLERPVY